jgi:hypothetical protein
VHVLVLAAEADETRQTITLLIACLVGIAALLAVLTAWFWSATSPRRRAAEEPQPLELLEPVPDHGSEVASSAGGAATVPQEEGCEVDPAEPTVLPEAGEAEPVEEVPTGPPVPAPQTWDFVAAARRAEEGLRGVPRPERPAAPRIALGARSAGGDDRADDRDELARARMKRERRQGTGLSDEAWAAVMRTAFDELDR